MLFKPCWSRLSWVKAWMLIGTSMILSERRCAVTTTSSREPAVAAAVAPWGASSAAAAHPAHVPRAALRAKLIAILFISLIPSRQAAAYSFVLRKRRDRTTRWLDSAARAVLKTPNASRTPNNVAIPPHIGATYMALPAIPLRERSGLQGS